MYRRTDRHAIGIGIFVIDATQDGDPQMLGAIVAADTCMPAGKNLFGRFTVLEGEAEKRKVLIWCGRVYED
ncbi:hypothetical protein D3C85_1323610 [compost metagenome]